MSSFWQWPFSLTFLFPSVPMTSAASDAPADFELTGLSVPSTESSRRNLSGLLLLLAAEAEEEEAKAGLRRGVDWLDISDGERRRLKESKEI